MNLFHIIKKNYFYLFIVCFIFVGVLLALNTGITHDEYHDLFVWKANQNLILNKLFNSNFDTSYITGGNLYYGSGFHYISFIIEPLTLQIPTIDNFDEIYDQDNNEDLNNICDECKEEDESVSQNLILTGFKICKSCRVSKTIFPI